ncbi:MAG: hypothetical protein JNG88_03865 [Phycisphaerales bacterium]|nr:hypothetical protein [Phycisphaerales bacterium]
MSANSSASEVRCHFLMLPGFLTKAHQEQPFSDTLDDELLAAAAQAAASWRDAKFVASRLEALRDARQLPGIAVCYYMQDRPTMPGAITVPFEPVTLDEAEPMICGLVDSAVWKGDSKTSPRNSINRTFLRIGIPLMVFANFGIQMAVQLIVHGGLIRWNMFLLLVTSFLIVVGGALIAYHASDRWFLIPGGVVRRKSLLRSWHGPLVRHTPRDTVMIIRPMPMGGGIAQLWRKGSKSERALTPTELRALIGAWKSPLPAPELDRLTDLQPTQ